MARCQQLFDAFGLSCSGSPGLPGTAMLRDWPPMSWKCRGS